MSSAAFPRALAFTSRWEGGTSNDPRDDGGLTVAGVIQRTYSRWRRKHGLPDRPVTESTSDEREQIYFEEFWQAAGCFNFGDTLAIVLFDCAVNPGVDRAVCMLQAVVNARIDGRLGPKTRSAVAAYSESRAARDLVNARKGYHVARAFADAHNWAFAEGWQNRSDDLLREIGMVGV